MRKVFLGVFLIVNIFTLASLLQYLPDDFITAVYIPDIARFYSDIKSTEIGDSFLNNLGFESMFDSLIRSQAQAYDIDADKLYQIKEFLFISEKNWIAIVIGPVQEFDKVKDYLESSGLISDKISFGEKNYDLHIENLEGNMVLYAGEGDVMSELKKKASNVPVWVKDALKDPKIDLVGYSLEKDSFESHIKVYSKGEVIASEGVSRVFDEDLMKEIKSLSNTSRFSESEVLNGEGFVLLNVKNGETLLDLFNVIGILNVLRSDENFDENIIKSFTGKAFIGFEYSKAIVDQMYGEGGEEVESTSKPLMEGFVAFDGNPHEILKDKLKSCENNGEYYVCEDTKIVIDGNKLFFFNPEDASLLSELNKKFFKSRYEGKENVMVYLDFSEVLNALFGLETNSYVLFKVWTENGEIRSYGEIR